MEREKYCKKCFFWRKANNCKQAAKAYSYKYIYIYIYDYVCMCVIWCYESL